MTPATSLTSAADPVLPQLRFRLPGDWWVIPLDDREAALASATRLIRSRLGAQDDRAAVRARLARDFASAVDEAISCGGQSMLIAVQVVEGVPLPISITVYLPELAMTPAVGTAPDRVLDILERGLEAARGSAVGDLGEFVRIDSAAVRTERMRTVEVAGGAGRDELDLLVVDYWLAVPGSKRVVLTSFSTPFVDLREYLLVFFDSVVRATYWDPVVPPVT